MGIPEIAAAIVIAYLIIMALPWLAGCLVPLFVVIIAGLWLFVCSGSETADPGRHEASLAARGYDCGQVQIDPRQHCSKYLSGRRASVIDQCAREVRSRCPVGSQSHAPDNQEAPSQRGAHDRLRIGDEVSYFDHEAGHSRVGAVESVSDSLIGIYDYAEGDHVWVDVGDINIPGPETY